MGLHSELDDQKVDALHVEQISTSSSNKHLDLLDDLDSIEKTQSGRYAWLVAITAGVGGLLFGKFNPFEFQNVRD